MTPDEYCRQKAAANGSTLHYSLVFLSAQRRAAIIALHAFCREVDEAVDEPGDVQVARLKISWWRNETARMFAGSPQHPVTRALQPALGPFGIGEAQFAGIIDGRQARLEQQRYADFADLEKYCQGVAEGMARLSARICGFRDDRTPDLAARLGVAFQLMEVIRNAGGAARRNRIYLPMDELRHFDVPASDILNRRPSGNFIRLMAFQADRAERHCADALSALPAVDRRAQHPAIIMAGIHRSELREIRRNGFEVLTHRTALTPVRKLWIAWKTWTSA